LTKQSKGVKLYNTIFILSVCRMASEKDKQQIVVLKGSSDGKLF